MAVLQQWNSSAVKSTVKVRDTVEKLTVPLAKEHKDLTQMDRLSVGGAASPAQDWVSISQGQKDSGFGLLVPLEI